MAEEDTAKAAVSQALTEFGGLDILVCNAVADVPLAPVTKISLADWRRTFAVNLDSAFLFSKHAIPGMAARGGGAIILIASQLGRVARPLRPWYCAAKGALIQLAKAMASRWEQMAQDGDHYRLAFDQAGTWSQKYNLVWDRILGLNLFPAKIWQTEIRFYDIDGRRDFGTPRFYRHFLPF